MQYPPPTFSTVISAPSARTSATNRDIFRSAFRNGATEQIGEPRCTWTPQSRTCGYRERSANIRRARWRSIPNLFSFLAVVVLVFVRASTSGFSRSATAALVPKPDAISLIAVSSDADSTVNIRIPALSAARISSANFPTPAKTTLAGSPPARNTRKSSPPETTSKPAPAFARIRKMDRLPLALTE